MVNIVVVELGSTMTRRPFALGTSVRPYPLPESKELKRRKHFRCDHCGHQALGPIAAKTAGVRQLTPTVQV